MIERNSIWVDTVKRGNMPLAVRGLGALTTNTTADLRLPLSMLKEVKPGQTVSIQFTNRSEMATGKVAGTSLGVTEGTVAVEITSALPPGVQQGIEVDGTIQVGRLNDVLWVGRPVECQPNSTGNLFKLEQNGEQAVRAKVEFGRAFAGTIEIRSGLAPGDKVILTKRHCAVQAIRPDHYVRANRRVGTNDASPRPRPASEAQRKLRTVSRVLGMRGSRFVGRVCHSITVAGFS